jgi:hypothetical protein
MIKRVPSKHPFIHGIAKLPDGRELCSPAVRKKRKRELWRRDPRCANPYCRRWTPGPEYGELAHKESKGKNSFKRDDSWKNILYLCVECNRRQGSIPWDEFLEAERERYQQAGRNSS